MSHSCTSTLALLTPILRESVHVLTRQGLIEDAVEEYTKLYKQIHDEYGLNYGRPNCENILFPVAAGYTKFGAGFVLAEYRVANRFRPINEFAYLMGGKIDWSYAYETDSYRRQVVAMCADVVRKMYHAYQEITELPEKISYEPPIYW